MRNVLLFMEQQHVD